MNIENDEKHYAFFLEVLKRFHLEPIGFFKRVANGDKYDTIIYSWINELYARGKSVNYTIQRIYKARYILFFKGKDIITIATKKKNDLENSDSCCDLLGIKQKSSFVNIAS